MHEYVLTFSSLFVSFTETVTFPCKMTSKYCGDLCRRRIRAETAQKNYKILTREIPSPCDWEFGRNSQGVHTWVGHRNPLSFVLFLALDIAVIVPTIV